MVEASFLFVSDNYKLTKRMCFKVKTNKMKRKEKENKNEGECE